MQVQDIVLQGLTQREVSGYNNFSTFTPLCYSYATFGLCAEIVDAPSYRVLDLEWGLNSFNWHYARFCTLLIWTRNRNILMLLLYTIPYEYLMSKTSQNIQRRGPWATEKLKYDPNSNWLSYARFRTLLPYYAELKPLTLPIYTISDLK